MQYLCFKLPRIEGLDPLLATVNGSSICDESCVTVWRVQFE